MKVVVTRSHRSTYPNPIDFAPGDELEFGMPDEEYPGWIRVTTKNGNQGWAPMRFLATNEGGTTATATVSYSARELDTDVGDRLSLHMEVDGWLLVEDPRGEVGWIPKATTAREG